MKVLVAITAPFRAVLLAAGVAVISPYIIFYILIDPEGALIDLRHGAIRARNWVIGKNNV